MAKYEITKEFRGKNSLVNVTLPPNQIKGLPNVPSRMKFYLDEATQSQLSLLHSLKHPAVQEVAKTK